jgi:UDP-sulfoquinovose synthase
MNVLVLGGDGYLGWPVALSLAKSGHNVTILDSLIKRKWQMESDSNPLHEVQPLHRRVKAFEEITGVSIAIHIGDITNVGAIYHIFDVVRPDLVILTAGQPSAPFSMKNRTNAIITQENIFLSAINTLFAMQRAQRDVNLIRLGSLGVYGTPDISIGDGYIPIEFAGRRDTLPYPHQPGSFHHLAECGVSSALLFACSNWGLKITELRLGVVYGMDSPETILHHNLATSFHYDAIFGTVANRFCVQAAVGHPLTVYGNGGQKRAFLCLTDVIQGVHLALQNPPEPGNLRVFNHFSEVLTIRELAERVQGCAKKSGLHVEIEPVVNPRTEKENHYYNPECKGLRELGFSYTPLEEVVDDHLFAKILGSKDRIDLNLITQYILWRKH